MTPKERAAMQQALEALEEYRDTQMIKAPRRAITALRETLAGVNMSPTEHAVIQQALEHKRSCAYKRIDQNPSECTCGVTKALTALREALADQAEQEPSCNQHPDAPHGFARNASHNAGRYVCECEECEPEQEPVAADGLARACNLAGIDYKDFLRIKAYLPIAAPVRTKDLTDDEIEKVWQKNGGYMGMPIDFARAVIAADREKNK